MIPRVMNPRLRSLLARFPVVLMLGPRQCGKTTLARSIGPGRYLDMELPSDRQLLSGDMEYTLRTLPAPVVIDEAQTVPELFPVLRALVDQARGQKGRFLLLGSVSPTLIEAIAESLAGRIGVLELTPFLFAEVLGAGVSLRDHWLRGGFPEPGTEADPASRHDWFEGYVRTFVERDVRIAAPRLMPAQLRRFVMMLAHYQGSTLNASELGRSLGVTYQTVNAYLDLLEGFFLARRLPPYHANLGKRLVKAPRVYLRDSGLLHHLLGIGDADRLAVAPGRGASWEGYVIEQILAREAIDSPATQPYFFRTQAGAEIDLILDRGHERIGFEIKAASTVGAADWRHLQSGVQDGLIQRGVVVHLGDVSFPARENVDVLSAGELLSQGFGIRP